MRQAHRQERTCYLYAFSGPRDVKELELKVDAPSLLELLAFLKYSFGGGTDVDRPLELSLDRLEQKDWSQVRAKSGSQCQLLSLREPCCRAHVGGLRPLAFCMHARQGCAVLSEFMIIA
jgi:acyl-CoA-binding protein